MPAVTVCGKTTCDTCGTVFPWEIPIGLSDGYNDIRVASCAKCAPISKCPTCPAWEPTRRVHVSGCQNVGRKPYDFREA